jgi:hypothetical protein
MSRILNNDNQIQTTFSLEKVKSNSLSSPLSLFIRNVDVINTCYEQPAKDVRIYYFYNDINNQVTLSTKIIVNIRENKPIAYKVITYQYGDSIVVFEDVEIAEFENEREIKQRIDTNKCYININSHNSSFKDSFNRALKVAYLHNTTISYKDDYDEEQNQYSKPTYYEYDEDKDIEPTYEI